MIFIYKITNIVTNEFYIGSTNNIEKRKRQHLYKLRNKKQANKKLQNSFNKYGENCFLFSILEKFDDDQIRIEKEQHWIDTLKPEFNFIKNVSNVHYPTPSEEVGRKISMANTGKKRPLSAVLITAAKNRGRKASLETRNKISMARAGKGTKGINGKIVLNLETGIYYKTIKEASFVTEYSYEHFARMLNGKHFNKTSFIFAN